MQLEKELQEKVDFAMNESLFTKEANVEPAVAFKVSSEQDVYGKRDTSNREEVSNSNSLLELLLGSIIFFIQQNFLFPKKMIQSRLHM